MPDTYHHSKFLTHRQKYLMAVREAQAAQYNRDEGFSWAEVRKALSDPMVHICACAQLVGMPCYYLLKANMSEGYRYMLVWLCQFFHTFRYSTDIS